jgi:transposase
MKYIEGQNRYQKTYFPDVIDDYITNENPVRVIDAFVDNLNFRELGFQSEPNELGRPSYNPCDMLKLYIYGYFNRIRSSRKLETETCRNIELIWLLNKLSPDHKTIARFRKDNHGVMKNVFRSFVHLCKELNLYGNELVAIDGSKFRAVNSRDNNFNQAKLDDRIKRIDDKLEQYLSELNQNDQNETDNPKHTKEEIEIAITELNTRKQNYREMKNRLYETGQTQISTTDPDAKRMKTSDGSTDVCFNVQTAVDAKNKLIVDYDVTNHCTDMNLLSTMAKSAKEVLGVDEIAVVADNGYYVPSEIVECMKNGITPHVSSEHDSVTLCVPTTEEESNEPQDFNNTGKNVFIKERNLGVCPMGNALYPKKYLKSQGIGVYQNLSTCKNCPKRSVCNENDKRIRVRMSEAEFALKYNDEKLYFKQIVYSPDKQLLRRRKEIVEHPFGTIKRNMDSSYCLLKGISKVRGEFALTFLAYNLKRAINIVGTAKLLHAVRG